MHLRVGEQGMVGGGRGALLARGSANPRFYTRSFRIFQGLSNSSSTDLRFLRRVFQDLSISQIKNKAIVLTHFLFGILKDPERPCVKNVGLSQMNAKDPERS